MKNNNAVSTHSLPNHLTLNILTDDDPQNPRTEWDNLGTMVCFVDRYNLGDEDHGGFSSPSDLLDYLKETPHIALPIFAYIHSGITISTTKSYPFNDPWDSGQAGIIFVTYEKIRQEYGWKYITSKRARQIREYLTGEIETYDQFLTGDVYGFTITCDECDTELEDSVWGFYGSNWKENGMKDHISNDLECPVCKAKQIEEMELEQRLAMVTL